MWRERVATWDVDWKRVRAQLPEWLLVADPRERTTLAGPYGYLVYDWWRRAVRCNLCGRWLRAITPYHLRQAHGYTVALYRWKFGLPADLRLSAEAARRRRHPAVVDWGKVPKPPGDKELAARTAAVTMVLRFFGFTFAFGNLLVPIGSAYADAHRLMPATVFAKVAGTGALAGLVVALSASDVVRRCRDLPPWMAFAAVEFVIVILSCGSYLTLADSLPPDLQISAGVDVLRLSALIGSLFAWCSARLWRDSDQSVPSCDRERAEAVTELRRSLPSQGRWPDS